MYRNQEVVHSGEPGEGVSFVINGIVKVACIDMQDTQDYFLGSGQSPACCWDLLVAAYCELAHAKALMLSCSKAQAHVGLDPWDTVLGVL